MPAWADHTTDKPSDKCGGQPVAFGTDGMQSVSVCAEPAGAVTAARKGDDDGYIVADRDNNNPLTAASQCFDGHIGVQFDNGTPSVAADDGEVTDGAGTHDKSYEYPQDTSGGAGDPNVCAPDGAPPPPIGI